MEHIVANWSVHSIASNIKGFSCKICFGVLSELGLRKWANSWNLLRVVARLVVVVAVEDSIKKYFSSNYCTMHCHCCFGCNSLRSLTCTT